MIITKSINEKCVGDSVRPSSHQDLTIKKETTAFPLDENRANHTKGIALATKLF